MNAFMILCRLTAIVLMTDLSSAFRKRVRGAVQSSTEPTALLAELEQALGGEQWAMHELREIEEDLKVTFKALPKNSRGAIAAPSARYALHRFFIQRHGWMVKGLETGGGAWDAESPISAMDAHVPTEIKELFEDRLGNYGMNLHELAVLAATMNNMFERDVDERLRIVYAGMNHSTEEFLGILQAHKVMLTYASAYVVGPQLEHLKPDYMKTAVADMFRGFPRTKEVVLMLERIRKQIAPDNRTYDFALLRKMASEFGHQLGVLENTACQAMQDALVKLEHQDGSGRVRLGAFYAAHDSFSESAEYLRSQGVLDESNPEDPKVLIPNYLANPSMCLTPSSYHSICCFDQCESLMDQIESGLEAPVGTPEKIASLVSSLRSPTTTLSPILLHLLDEVAGHHGGMIPIHGRLFSQWMHQAYPRECSFPHNSGIADRFKQQDSWSYTLARPEDKRKYEDLARQAKENDSADVTAPMWTMHEVLVDEKTLNKTAQRASRVEGVLFLGLVGFCRFMVAKDKLDLVLSSWLNPKNKLP